MKGVFEKSLNIFLLIFFFSDIAYASQPDYSLGGAFIKLILYMVTILFVLGLAIFGTRFLAKNSQRFIKSKYMKIIDILNVGTSTKILMIEIEDYIYIIVVTNNSSELIEKIKKDEFIKNGGFEDKLTRHTLSYMNIDKVMKVLNKNYKDNGEEDENEYEI